MAVLFELLSPLLATILVGWLSARFRLISSEAVTGLGELVGKLLIPCMLFGGAYRYGLPAHGAWAMLAAFYLPVALLLLLQAYGMRHHDDPASISFVSVYSNTVFIGLPVLSRVLGESSQAIAYPIIGFHGLLTFLLFYGVSGWKTARRGQWWSVVRRTAGNPLVVSLLLGLLANTAGLRLPSLVAEVLRMVGQAALPCALLMLGAALFGFRIRDWRGITGAVVVKLAVLPLAVWASTRYVFGLAPGVVVVETLLAACPIAINAYPIVLSEGCDGQLAGSAILLSSLVSLATLPLWIHWLAH
jgi:predicted permease